MEQNWILKPLGNQEDIDKLSKELTVSPIIANMLVQRGITTYEGAKSFFRPSLDDLHDPFLMKDMDKAVQRLEKAFENNENILIYGDYDVDGTTSVALLYSFIKGIHKNIDYYIPDRYSEGYGISYIGIDYAEFRQLTCRSCRLPTAILQLLISGSHLLHRCLDLQQVNGYDLRFP